jgi:DNA-binding NtrC family response regulator
MATLIPRLEEDFERIRAVAKGSLTLTILGESGTGKELLASAVHTLSGRPGTFVAVNCGAIPATLIASELFGCHKGAFSGAAEDRRGLIRSAEGGTLFLDEIGEIPPEGQLALLRVLQEKEVLPLGATRPVSIDVRFLSATSRDLTCLVADGRFRPDLQARLAGFVCRLPRLAERREDLGLILTDRLRAHATENVRLSLEAARALWRYAWPGNVRELDHCVHAAVLLAHGARIGLAHLPEPVQSSLEELPPSRKPSALSKEDTQRREQLLHLLQSHAGNISAVAREMGKERKQVHRWLERYGIDPASFRR